MAGNGPAPNFICIGSQKAGTTTLYDRLSTHSDVQMPPIKELHFFDGVMRGEDYDRLGFIVARARNQAEKTGSFSPFQRDFVERWLRLVESDNPDVEGYAALWTQKGGNVSGDITPGYMGIGKKMVREISKAFPQTRAFILLREPVSRLWSQIQMLSRAGHVKGDILDPEVFEAECQRGVVRNRSRQARACEIWGELFEGRFEAFFMDDLIKDPDAYYRSVFSYLEIDTDPSKVSLPSDFSHNTKEPKVRMPEGHFAIATKHLENEHERLAELLGGHALKWLDAKNQQLAK